MRLVIADDDRWVRGMLGAALKGPGIEIVGEAPDGASALLMVVELRPDVLVTDIRMPYLDGIRLTRYVSEAFGDLDVYGFTGDDDHQALLAAGATQVFTKPDVDELVDVIERAGEARGLLRPRRKRSPLFDDLADLQKCGLAAETFEQALG